MEDCPACKVAKMMLKDRGIPYEYIDLEEDDFYRDRLVQKVGNFSIPKFEWGDKILDYNMNTMEEIFKDFA